MNKDLHSTVKNILDNHNVNIEEEDFSLEERVFAIEQQLHHEQLKKERRSQVFLNSPFGHIITTSYDQITDINYAMLKFLGYTEVTEVKYKNIQDILHAEDTLPMHEFRKKTINYKDSMDFFPLRFKHKKGHYVLCDVAVAAVYFEGNEYFFGYIQKPKELFTDEKH